MCLSSGRWRTFVFEYFLSHRPHVAFLEPPTFGGVDESPPDRLHCQLVAAVLPASEVLEEEATEGMT